MNDWGLASQALALQSQKKTASSQTTIDPEDLVKSFQRKAETNEPSIGAFKNARTVYWSTPVPSDPDAELDKLSEQIGVNPFDRATDSDEESRHVYAVPAPSWNSDEEDSCKYSQLKFLSSLLIMLDATSDESAG